MVPTLAPGGKLPGPDQMGERGLQLGADPAQTGFQAKSSAEVENPGAVIGEDAELGIGRCHGSECTDRSSAHDGRTRPV